MSESESNMRVFIGVEGELSNSDLTATFIRLHSSNMSAPVTFSLNKKIKAPERSG